MLSGAEKSLLALLVLLLMTGLGATLTPTGLAAVLKRPKGVVIGLLSQFGWMPLVAFVLAKLLGLPAAMALGLVIVGCTPGGTTSNLFTYYARADVGLSVAMTACSTLVAVVAMPLLLAVYAAPFAGVELAIPYGSIATTLAVVLVPVMIGMAVRRRSVAAAKVVERVGSVAGAGVLLLLVATGLLRNGRLLWEATWAMYAAALGLGVLGFGLGYVSAKVAGMSAHGRRAVAFETGIQNSPLALAIIVASFSTARQAEIMWLPLMYALMVLLSASVVALVMRRRQPAPAAA